MHQVNLFINRILTTCDFFFVEAVEIQSLDSVIVVELIQLGTHDSIAAIAVLVEIFTEFTNIEHWKEKIKLCRI